MKHMKKQAAFVGCVVVVSSLAACRAYIVDDGGPVVVEERRHPVYVEQRREVYVEPQVVFVEEPAPVIVDSGPDFVFIMEGGSRVRYARHDFERRELEREHRNHDGRERQQQHQAPQRHDDPKGHRDGDGKDKGHDDRR